MKSKYNLFQAILLAFIIPFTFTACDDDDKAVPESQVSWTLSLPEDIENPTLSDLKVTVTNINTNTQYDGSVSMNEQTVTVTGNRPGRFIPSYCRGKSQLLDQWYPDSDSCQYPCLSGIGNHQRNDSDPCPHRSCLSIPPLPTVSSLKRSISPVVRLLPETNTALTNTSKFTTTLQKYCMPTVWQFWNRNL